MSLVLLMPNAKRVQIKVTPNTSLLEVLEQACEKQNLIPINHELFFSNRPVDLSNPFRLSGIPNNATVEVREAVTPRVEGNVTVCLQFESEGRKVADFPSSTSIWAMIETLNPSFVQQNPNESVACIYMRQEIVGKDQLLQITLRKLGLVTGKVALRVKVIGELASESERYKYNLNIAPRERSPSPPPRPKQSETAASKEETKSPSSKKLFSQISEDPVPGPSQTQSDSFQSSSIPSKYGNNDQLVKDKLSFLQSKIFKGKPPTKPQSFASLSQPLNRPVQSEQIFENADLTAWKPIQQAEGNTEPIDQFTLDELRSKVNQIGSSKAILFKQPDSIGEREEIPEEFFQITLEDVRSMYHDLVMQRKKYVDRPFESREVRKAQESQIKPKYEFSIVRINFPNDKLVLQLQMTPDQTIGQLLDHLKEFMDDCRVNPTTLYLFTAPPKTILHLNHTFEQSNLVPAANIHLGGSNLPVLKSSLVDQISDYEHVNRYTCALRKLQKHF